MSTKRNRVVITIAEKLEAMKRMESGEILQNVASDFGVGISTVKIKSKFEEHS